MRAKPEMTIFNKTFDYSNSTPIVSAIRAIVRLDNPNVLVLDYRRDEAAFKELWALDGNNVPTMEAGGWLLEDLADTNKTIILVDVDSSAVIASDKFGRHLSALSWAHCLTHSLVLTQKSAPNIVILDLRNEASVLQDSTFADFFNLPSSSKPSNIQRYDAVGFDEFVLYITKKREIRLQCEGIKTFAKRWKSALVEADSRSTQHDLNNTMGPLSLAASVSNDILNAQVITVTKNKNDILGRAAMLRAMQWVVKFKSAQSGFQPVHFNVDRELRILLLDDQAKDGWLPVLSHYLGLVEIPGSSAALKLNENGFQQYAAASSGGKQVSLWYATSPDQIVKMLGEAAKATQQKVARLRFTEDATPGSSGNFDELLLLDLRLYGGGALARADAEMAFLKEVVTALQAAKGGGQSSWGDQIEGEGFRDKQAYLQALSGLAQLISAVDFSYPIVVWSSTGQRKVTECFREFKNIFTGLEKPRFDSYVSDADDLRFALDEVFLWARKQLQAVSFFDELMALNKTTWEPPDATYPYAEVYIEEDGTSDKQSFKVGALIAFYTCMRSAEKLHKEIGTHHFGGSLAHKNNKNSTSFPSSGGGQQLASGNTTLAFCGKSRLPKKLSFDQLSANGLKGHLNDMSGNRILNPCNAVAVKLKTLLLKHNVKCMMVTSSLKAPTPPKDIDPRYLFLLSDVLRVALTLFLAGKDVRVFVATKRQSNISNTKEDALSVARNYFEKWGVLSEVKANTQPTPVKISTSYSSINNHSALHAAIDAHSYSDGIQNQAKLCGARGVTLSYKNATPRPAHYEWQIIENIFQAESSGDIRASLSVNGANGLKTITTSEEALKCSFPHSFSLTSSGNISDMGSWRNLHYYADELLEKDSRKEFIGAGVVTEDSLFDRSLLSDNPNKDSQLLILNCGRSTLQNNLTDAIESYASAVMGAESPLVPYADGNRKFRNYIGSRLAANLATNKKNARDAYETLLNVVEARFLGYNKKKEK
jgi:hypothetical protein